MYSKEELHHMITARKWIKENIKWKPYSQKKTKYIFRVQVLSEDNEGFFFLGNYSVKGNLIKNLTLLHNKKFPLVRLDKSKHTNPEEYGGNGFEDWHKHEYDPLYKDDIARDVSDEFNDQMSPDEFVLQFMKENHMVFQSGLKYQGLLDSFTKKR